MLTIHVIHFSHIIFSFHRTASGDHEQLDGSNFAARESGRADKDDPRSASREPITKPFSFSVSTTSAP